jgi:hypothetical protein
MSFSADDQKPPILPIWPLKIGTNLTRSEIFALKNTCFQLPPKERITSTQLFTNYVVATLASSPLLTWLFFRLSNGYER